MVFKIQKILVPINYEEIAKGIRGNNFDYLLEEKLIANNFPIVERKNGVVDFSVFNFGFEIITDKIFTAISRQNLRPAELVEIVAFAMTYPQDKVDIDLELSPILAFGSRWKSKDDILTLSLYGNGEDGVVNLKISTFPLYPKSKNWSPRYCFLAVPQ